MQRAEFMVTFWLLWWISSHFWPSDFLFSSLFCLVQISSMKSFLSPSVGWVWRRVAGGDVLEALDDGRLAAAVLGRDSIDILVTSTSCFLSKAVLYRDTVLVDTGSRPFFGSVSASLRQILGIEGIRHFFQMVKIRWKCRRYVHETVSVCASPNQIFCVGNNLSLIMLGVLRHV